MTHMKNAAAPARRGSKWSKGFISRKYLAGLDWQPAPVEPAVYSGNEQPLLRALVAHGGDFEQGIEPAGVFPRDGE